MHTKKQRTLAFIICMAMIATALFSMLFIVKESGHDCTGKDCPVCACIHQAARTLKLLGTGDAGRALPVLDFFSAVAAFFLAPLFVPCATLIDQKVRLNN